MAKFLEVTHRDKTYEMGRKQERKALKSLGAKPTPRSGAGRTKGDGRAKAKRGELHIEVKATAKKSYALTQKVLEKLRKEAGYDRHPTLVVTLTAHGESWVCVPVASFVELTGLEIES